MAANRNLRNYLLSRKVNSVSFQAEVFFVRLIQVADDYGCYFASPAILKPHLFPLRVDSIREADMSRWIAECEKAGLIALYEHEGKPYLVIKDFGQRLRIARRKFPVPPDGIDCGNPPTNVSDPPQPAAGGGLKRRETEVEEKREGKALADTFGQVNGHFVIVKAKYAHQNSARINGKAGLIAYMEANLTVLNLPEYAEKFMRNNNGKVFNELGHLQNAYARFIEIQATK